jgi:TIR domain
MAGIFISYRERDSKAWALSLRDRLVDEFGEDKVFLDKDTLKAGKWKDQIERALGDCNIVLVVIGRDWLQAQDDEGRLRLMAEDDVHRREIALALARSDVTVIPVLVDGATMPRPDELPDNIRELVQQQSRSISDSAAHRKVDLDSLSADIRRVGRFPSKINPTPNPPPQPPSANLKTSGKVITAFGLLALIFAASTEGLDHDEKLGAVFFAGLGLWFAYTGFKDIKAGLSKGKGLAYAALGLSGLTGLGMIGALSQPDAPSAPPNNPVVANIAALSPGPASAPVPVAVQAPVGALKSAPEPKPLLPKEVAVMSLPKPIVASPQPEPAQPVHAANFRGIWQDAGNISIFYVIRQENNAVHLQEYNALGALTFEAMGNPKGNGLTIHHPVLAINLTMSDDGRQIDGSVKQKATGLVNPILLRKVELDGVDPQIAALLRPLVE